MSWVAPSPACSWPVHVAEQNVSVGLACIRFKTHFTSQAASQELTRGQQLLNRLATEAAGAAV